MFTPLSPEPKTKESSIFYHPDGYVEIIFHGIQSVESLEELILAYSNLLQKHGRSSVLIDGRNGRVDRDARSFSIMLNMGRHAKLKKMVILTSSDPQNPNAIHGPSIVTAILTAALGFRPTYIGDEAAARRLAMQP